MSPEVGSPGAPLAITPATRPPSSKLITTEPTAVTMGVASLRDLFNEQYYAGLEGGILEAFGKLFTKDLRIYVYPLRDAATGELKTVETMEMPGQLQNLFLHLVERGRIKQLDNFDETALVT